MQRFTLDPRAREARANGQRPRRALLAVDFGAASLAAASWAARYLLPDAELVIAHVLPVPTAPRFLRRHLRPAESFVREVSEPMETGLRGLASTLGPSRTSVELRDGVPAVELAKLAIELDVDVVCVGRPRRGGRTRELGRNTVDRLLRRISVPLIQGAGNTDAAPASMVVALDGGSSSQSVLQQASSMAARLESRLTALHVIDEDVRAYTRAMEVVAGTAANAGAAEDALWASTAGWLGDALSTSGIRRSRSHVMVGMGDPGEEVLAACRRAGADMLVVGRSGHDAPAPNAVGSTTRYLLGAAACPVFVVPEPPPPVRPLDGRGRRRGRSSAPASSPVPVRLSGTSAFTGDVAHRGSDAERANLASMQPF